MINILSVIGARPQFIKASSLSRALRCHKELKESIVHTGQHYDENMSGIFFSELQIPKPDFELNVGSGTHAEQTAAMLLGIGSILTKKKFDLVLVYGDTNSTIAGALAAAKLNIPVAHVEAGLRSFDMAMPEEVNRILTDQISSIHFCPSKVAIKNLSNMGIRGEYVVNCGDIMLETQLYYKDVALKNTNYIKQLNLTMSPYHLVTFHRVNNTDNPTRLKAICRALCELATSCRIIIPLHPRTRSALQKLKLLDTLNKNCEILEPASFLEMINLIQHSNIVITDSGGIQKEAFFMKKHCIVIRDETEWTELVTLGAAQLWDVNSKSQLKSLINNIISKPLTKTKPYGNGNTSKIITKRIYEYFSKCA